MLNLHLQGSHQSRNHDILPLCCHTLELKFAIAKIIDNCKPDVPNTTADSLKFRQTGQDLENSFSFYSAMEGFKQLDSTSLLASSWFALYTDDLFIKLDYEIYYLLNSLENIFRKCSWNTAEAHSWHMSKRRHMLFRDGTWSPWQTHSNSYSHLPCEST